jgi:hypothetical protein
VSADEASDSPEGAQYFPADGTDRWWRHALRPREVPTTWLDRATYISDTLDRPTEERPWFKELSGRIQSRARSLVHFARNEADRLNRDSIKRKKKATAAFRGFYLGDVTDIRAMQSCDVYIEPTDSDEAHANLVVAEDAFDSEGKIDFAVLEHLVSVVTFHLADSGLCARIEAELG